MAVTITIDVTSLTTAIAAATTAINGVATKIDGFIFQESHTKLTDAQGNILEITNVGVPVYQDPGDVD